MKKQLIPIYQITDVSPIELQRLVLASQYAALNEFYEPLSKNKTQIAIGVKLNTILKQIKN